MVTLISTYFLKNNIYCWKKYEMETFVDTVIVECGKKSGKSK